MDTIGTIRSMLKLHRRVLFKPAAVVLAAAFPLLNPSGFARAATIETIYSFTGGADGSVPHTGLIAGPQGALYGANQSTVYQLSLGSNGKWTVTPIYATPNGPAQSLASYGGSLYVALGVLYGKPCPQSSTGCGEIVELTPPAKSGSWTATTVYDFKGGKDGAYPSGITVSSSGVIYGVTLVGGNATGCGSNSNGQTGCGTVFGIQKPNGAWKEKVLVALNATNGAFPEAAPILGVAPTPSVAAASSSGPMLYGSANQGGQEPPREGTCDGFGVFFGVLLLDSESDAAIPLLQKVCADEDDDTPYYFEWIPFLSPHMIGPPSLAPSGTSANWMIGAGTGGGNVNDCPGLSNNGCGGVFLLTQPANGSTPWTETVLHNFTGPPDGAFPEGFLLQDGADTLYGITVSGGIVNTQCGANGCGTIYKLTQGKSGWAWGGVAYKLPGGSHGANPVQGLTLYQNKIVGVTNQGGSGCGQFGCGTIFVFTP